MTIGTTVDNSAPPQNSSVRTIILGIDHSGRIVQHDRTAPAVLARPADKLLGATLSDLLTEVGATDQRAGKTAGKSRIQWHRSRVRRCPVRDRRRVTGVGQ